MTINILSPHIDDAAYCLAISISRFVEKNVSIQIINCFTITKWTIAFVPGGIEEITLLRKKEDEAFYKKYNAPISIINLDMLDAPLRNTAIFMEKPFRKLEWETVAILKNYLEKNVNDILFCPLAIGNHIDHAICIEAVLQLYDKMKIIFFEDLPYASRISEKEILRHIRKIEKRLKTEFVSFLFEENNCLINKEQNLRLYETQLNDTICAEIITHLHNLHGERLWGDKEVINQLSSSLNYTFPTNMI